MKYKGKTLESPEPRVIVIPRGSEKIVIKAAAVLDFSPYEELCPFPKPPMITRKGESARPNPEDPKFREDVTLWVANKHQWMFLKSLEDSDLEFESVDMSDPTTWDNATKELRKCFSGIEIDKIVELVYSVCGMSEELIKEATESFLSEAR